MTVDHEVDGFSGDSFAVLIFNSEVGDVGTVVVVGFTVNIN